MNPDKTERTTLFRRADHIEEEWRMTRKLRSLLGDCEDVARRKQLVAVAFASFWSLWKRGSIISEKRRMRLYKALVLPILLYHSCTWALTKSALDQLDAFHRQQLRSLIQVKWPQKISNVALLQRSGVEPLSRDVKRARWRLLGHIRRLPDECPARMAIEYYFKDKDAKKWRADPATLSSRFSQLI
ncbi:uncharacterized protein LOC135810628 [Sycon ciliatum]|uniref:uncharacterized protein LOC135810628 n=1 Tax=Sycon ciliatum TaxID=27933 RepID=UPI0031F61FDF